MLSASWLYFESIKSLLQVAAAGLLVRRLLESAIDFVRAIWEQFPLQMFLGRNRQTFIGARKRESSTALPGASGLCHFPPACDWLRPEVKIRVNNGPIVTADRGAGSLWLKTSSRRPGLSQAKAGSSSDSSRRVSLMAVPRRDDDNRIRVRNGPSCSALV
jgi:hypothetical protein